MSLESKLQYEFRSKGLLEQALTHKSYCFEKGGQGLGHNEVLEFLGDSVLGLALALMLIEKFPDDNEGVLSKKRASLENETALARIAGTLDLGNEIRMGKGETLSGGAQRPRVLASCFEALIGAVARDGGYAEATRVIENIFLPVISNEDWGRDFDLDFKTRFQELAQRKFGMAPLYRVVEEEGPSHAKIFRIEVLVRDEVIAVGQGPSKKLAEQEAAKKALEVSES